MKLRIFNFFGSVLFLLGTLGVIYPPLDSLSQSEPSSQVKKVPLNQAQKNTLDRTWTDPLSERLWTAGTDEKKASFLLNASLVRTGRNDTVYVFDRGDMSVKVFDAEGTFLYAAGGTRGRGPGELMNPTGFDVDNKGRIWIADPSNGRISVYGAQGNFSRNLRLKRRPDRIVVPGNGTTFYLAWLSPTKTALFARYDAQGTRLQEFGPVVEDQVERGMALDGWIGIAPDRSLYYTPTRAGRLMRFDSGGNKTLDVKTIDFAPIPEVIVDERGGRRVSPSASILSLGLQVVGQSIYIFSILPDETKAERSFDVYNRAGQYRRSIPLPDGTSNARFTPNRIYTITDTSLTAWALPK